METTKCREGGRFGVPSIERSRSVAEAAALLAKAAVGALVVVDGRRESDDAIVGLLTERDICRAVAAQGLGVYDLCVWVIADSDYPRLDVASSSQDRLQAFCDRKTNHILLMDGMRVSGILDVWDCAESHVRQTSRDTEALPA